MSERKLRSRRRKPNVGHVIRVSNFVYDVLDEKRDGVRSWDKLMRRILGLPARNGAASTLIEGVLESTTGVFILRLNAAPWEEVEEMAWKLGAKRRGAKRVEPPIRMREVV